jgi:hypothetical protein
MMSRFVKREGPIRAWLKRLRAKGARVPGAERVTAPPDGRRKVERHTVLDRIELFIAARVKRLLRVDAERKATWFKWRRNRVTAKLRDNRDQVARLLVEHELIKAARGVVLQRIQPFGEFLIRRNGRSLTILLPGILFLGGWALATLAFSFFASAKADAFEKAFLGIDRSLVAGFVIELALAGLAKIAGLNLAWALVPKIGRLDKRDGAAHRDEPLVYDQWPKAVRWVAAAGAIVIAFAGLYAIAKLRMIATGIFAGGNEQIGGGVTFLGGGPPTAQQVSVGMFIALEAVPFSLQVLVAWVVATPLADALGKLEKRERRSAGAVAGARKRQNRLLAKRHTLSRRIAALAVITAELQEVAVLDALERGEHHVGGNPNVYGVTSDSKDMDKHLDTEPFEVHDAGESEDLPLPAEPHEVADSGPRDKDVPGSDEDAVEKYNPAQHDPQPQDSADRRNNGSHEHPHSEPAEETV